MIGKICPTEFESIFFPRSTNNDLLGGLLFGTSFQAFGGELLFGPGFAKGPGYDAAGAGTGYMTLEEFTPFIRAQGTVLLHSIPHC